MKDDDKKKSNHAAKERKDTVAHEIFKDPSPIIPPKVTNDKKPDNPGKSRTT